MTYNPLTEKHVSISPQINRISRNILDKYLSEEEKTILINALHNTNKMNNLNKITSKMKEDIIINNNIDNYYIQSENSVKISRRIMVKGLRTVTTVLSLAQSVPWAIVTSPAGTDWIRHKVFESSLHGIKDERIATLHHYLTEDLIDNIKELLQIAITLDNIIINSTNTNKGDIYIVTKLILSYIYNILILIPDNYFFDIYNPRINYLDAIIRKVYRRMYTDKGKTVPDKHYIFASMLSSKLCGIYQEIDTLNYNTYLLLKFKESENMTGYNSKMTRNNKMATGNNKTATGNNKTATGNTKKATGNTKIPPIRGGSKKKKVIKKKTIKKKN